MLNLAFLWCSRCQDVCGEHKETLGWTQLQIQTKQDQFKVIY